MNKTIIFIRNDDVRDKLDLSLIKLTNICIKHSVPISFAVEPKNVTDEVVKWLLDKKRNYPDLIEIIQHGYDHNIKFEKIKGKKRKIGEFGGGREFIEQYNDLKQGHNLMDKQFGNYWTPIISFPFGSFDKETLNAVEKIGYKAISSSVSYSFLHSVKNAIGQMLKLDFLLNRKISYHLKSRNNRRFKEISVSVNIIKSYIDEHNAVHNSLEQILDKINIAAKYSNVVGILLHHRFHENEMDKIEQLIKHLTSSLSYGFKKMEELC